MLGIRRAKLVLLVSVNVWCRGLLRDIQEGEHLHLDLSYFLILTPTPVITAY